MAHLLHFSNLRHISDIHSFLMGLSKNLYVYLIIVLYDICCYIVCLYRKQYVFLSANHLVNQTNLLMKTVKDALE